MTLSALRGKAWRRVGFKLYRWAEQKDDPLQTLSAWRRLLHDDVVFSGTTAAWLFGLDVEPTNPVEVVAPSHSGLRSRAALLVGRYEIPTNEIVSVRGFRATALPRTLTSLCLRRSALEALVAIDMALRLRLVDSDALGKYAEAANGRAGAAAYVRLHCSRLPPSPLWKRAFGGS